MMGVRLGQEIDGRLLQPLGASGFTGAAAQLETLHLII